MKLGMLMNCDPRFYTALTVVAARLEAQQEENVARSRRILIAAEGVASVWGATGNMPPPAPPRRIEGELDSFRPDVDAISYDIAKPGLSLSFTIGPNRGIHERGVLRDFSFSYDPSALAPYDFTRRILGKYSLRCGLGNVLDVLHASRPLLVIRLKEDVFARALWIFVSRDSAALFFNRHLHGAAKPSLLRAMSQLVIDLFQMHHWHGRWSAQEAPTP